MQIPTEHAAEQFKLADAASYDHLIDSFDDLTRKYTQDIASQLIDWAAPATGDRILDVGCGTGVLTLGIAARANVSASVVGFDLSQPMLTRAAASAERAGISSKVRFQQGDAENLPFGAAEFDRVVSLYALRHFPNPARALQEMLRVVKPGGVVVIGVGSAPPLGSSGFIGAVANKFSDLFKAIIGRPRLFAPQSLDRFLDKSWGATAHHEEARWTHGVADYSQSVAQMMRKAGAVAVSSTWFGSSDEIANGEDYWNLQSTLSSYARKRLAAAPVAKISELRAAYIAHCQTCQERGSQLVYRSGALVTRGVRSATR